MLQKIGRALIGVGLLMFVAGAFARRLVPRDDVPNVTYLGIYVVAGVVLGTGWLLYKRKTL
jgi:ABC-type Fe3+ transport system permease subunit